MNFAAKLKQTVEAVEASGNSEQARRYRVVLDELVEGLQSLGVGARIDAEVDPRKQTLYLYPPYRPQRGNRMVRFFLDGAEMTVTGATSTQVKTPEELESWLLDYVKLPAFIESLRELRELAEKSVEARLRVSRKFNYHKDDIMVEVSSADQKRLWETSVGASISFEVKRMDFPGNPRFEDEETRYEVLNSAGLFLDVDTIQRTDERVTIVGRRSDRA